MMTVTLGTGGERRSEGAAMRPMERMGRLLTMACGLVSVWLERRRQRRQLETLSEAMLKDIGVSRTDVWRETRKPFWHE